MFTCLCSYVVYIETTQRMTTDSFIQALRRLMSRRRNIKMLKINNGSNFVGPSSESKKVFSEMDKKKINFFLMELGGDA